VAATTWPEPVERVSSFLKESGGEGRIQEFADVTPTAADAAAQVGCGLEQIVKSLLFICDARPVLAMIPGDRRGDPAKIAGAAGATEVRVATAREVEQETGFAPGAVAPFPLPRIDLVLIERELLRHPLVWTGAGSERHLLGIAPAELARVARARPMDVVAEQAYDSPTPKES
jgi:prolyl-tRNA editing enzyme YbaK/EbsC (Cys-tRNA(Pro) deacylase)